MLSKARAGDNTETTTSTNTTTALTTTSTTRPADFTIALALAVWKNYIQNTRNYTGNGRKNYKNAVPK